MLRCKNPIVYYWGVQFEVGKIYQISESLEGEVSVITEYDNYWEMNRIMSMSGEYLRKGIEDPFEIEKNLPGYIEALSCFKNKNFTKKIKLPFVSIMSETNYQHFFCNLTTEKISEKYNIDLDPNYLIPFVNSVNIIYDNFDYICDIRNEQLNDLGIN
jgi:hypothetical protein